MIIKEKHFQLSETSRNVRVEKRRKKQLPRAQSNAQFCWKDQTEDSRFCRLCAALCSASPHTREAPIDMSAVNRIISGGTSVKVKEQRGRTQRKGDSRWWRRDQQKVKTTNGVRERRSGVSRRGHRIALWRPVAKGPLMSYPVQKELGPPCRQGQITLAVIH